MIRFSGKTIVLAGAVAACAVIYAVAGGNSPAIAEDAFTPAQKEALGPVIRDYLVKNPEVIVEALTEYQKKQASMEAMQFTERLSAHKGFLMDGGAPFAGNPKGDVTVVEFFDYNCGYCKKAVDDVVKLVEEDKNVKVVFHEMPILSPVSQDAARWALAAHKQGKYFEYHVALMKGGGARSVQTLESTAKDVGLDVAKMKKDADSKEVRDMVEQSVSVARDLGIRGTPAFIIGDMLAPGYLGLDAMKETVAKAREGSKQ